MSFFDRQGIPKDLLRPRTERQGAQTIQTEKLRNHGDSDSEDELSQSRAGDNEFEDDIVSLRNFCFISVDTSGTSFEMHALVQLATRLWLEANSKLEQWKEQFVSNPCAAFPTGGYENWAACRALFAHARSAVGQPPERVITSRMGYAALSCSMVCREDGQQYRRCNTSYKVNESAEEGARARAPGHFV
jgi:hypothetical protein